MSNLIKKLCDFKTSSDRFPFPVKSAVKSYLTAWCDQNLSNRALNALTVLASVVRYPRYLDTYRRYLRDDTSIAEVTIYRGIS